ncbi:hypothetical protein FNX39_12805 [Salmonella enterica]|nr:hypothetical protein [Salmonella enterica]ECH9651396.1 hypothetical protein [Salmonella enterica subsp. enterica serovar Miami]EAU5969191.1 hypothetical protein [Salmonella enterica]EAV4451451.1 hypothetical protein [Salmonella enterica]EBB5640113.1 hypothetical protein [Salmonella enterica]
MKSWVKMNSWTSEDTKAVKTWFDLDRYREFENISINMLYHEIWARTYFFKPVIEEGMHKTVLKNYMQILEGNPFLIKEKDLNYMDAENKLYQPPYFFLTTVDRIANISFACMKKALFIRANSEKYKIDSTIENEYISEKIPEQFPTTIMLEIDLAAGSDDEIAEALRISLPQWRKVKGVKPAPLDAVRFGYGTIKKLMSYRIIPMLDLLAWSERKKVHLSDDRISRLIYRDEDDDKVIRQGYHIRDADRPLAMKVVENDFLRQFYFFINKNRHIKEMSVYDVMKITDTD